MDIGPLDDFKSVQGDVFEAGLKSDHLASNEQRSALDKFLKRTWEDPLPQSPEHYCSPMERFSVVVEGYNPLGSRHTERPSSQWEKPHVKNAGFHNFSSNHIGSDIHHANQQQQGSRCDLSTLVGDIQSGQAHSYIPVVKQRVERYDRTMYSSCMESSFSENGFPLSSFQSAPSPVEGQRKEKRKQQNQRAAKKYRQKQKFQEDFVVKNVAELKHENNKMRQEVDILNRQLAELAEGLQTHHSVCPHADNLPEIDPNSHRFTYMRG